MNEPQEKRRRRISIEGLIPARKQPDEQAPPAPTSKFLIGHGYDIHRLQPGGKLTLCGVVVSEEMSPIAHSDGDVAYHALVDAILGAMGLGDIGESFPNSDPKWKNAESRVFVQTALRRAARAGYVPANIDVTLLIEKPKISPFKQQMLAALRKLVGPGVTINIKAGTNEGCDAVGKGEAVASTAVVLLAARK
jgi:2-C-methyl-D-erythritol 2,4-cyclodiphosphate synthase